MPRYVLVNLSPFDLEVTQSGLHLSADHDDDWLQLPRCAADEHEHEQGPGGGARQVTLTLSLTLTLNRTLTPTLNLTLNRTQP